MNKMSDALGYEQCYEIEFEFIRYKGVSCAGFRLPSDVEWEYAARTQGKDEYIYSGSNALGDVSAWGRTSTYKVKSYQPNGMGLYDMTGNVFEWVWDEFVAHDQYDEVSNPIGRLHQSSTKINRGGSFGPESKYLKVYARNHDGPNDIFNNVGFRICRTTPP